MNMKRMNFDKQFSTECFDVDHRSPKKVKQALPNFGDEDVFSPGNGGSEENSMVGSAFLTY